jgi:hypothetical protein
MRQSPVAPSRFLSRLAAALLLAGALAAAGPASPQGAAPPVKVTFEDAQPEVTEAVLPVDPTPRIAYGLSPNQSWGLTYKQQRITYGGPGGGHDIKVRIDGQEFTFGQQPGRLNPQQVPLGKGAFGRTRHGVRSTWEHNKVFITQILEIVPSKPSGKVAPGQKRQLDTLLVRYLVENKDSRPHKVAIRNTIDMYMVNNDGALFASPTTHPNQILNGKLFTAKDMPAYVQVLQQPNLQMPGQVGHFTLKLGRVEGPSRFVLTNLGVCFGGWEVPAAPAGDSAVAVFFDDQDVRPGAKRDMAYAYGIGIASSPENEGRVTMALGGSFEPKKAFTITAYVDEPVEGQSLTLELPAGVELLEGKQVQPVPAPLGGGSSLVLWRARVHELGRYPLRIRSSTGLTQTRTVTVSR